MTISRLPLLALATVLMADAAQAQTSPVPPAGDPLDRAAFKTPIAPAYVPDRPILPEGVARTSVERTVRGGVTGSLGFLCGLQAPYAHDGIADARGYDPATGAELWRLAKKSEVTIPTPVLGKDLAFVSSGNRPIQPILAIRPGAAGDLRMCDPFVTAAGRFVKTSCGFRRSTAE